MSTPPPPEDRPGLRLTTTDAEDGVRVALSGDLDRDTADELLREVDLRLTDGSGAPVLRLDCAELGAIDSMGLSALLMVRRRTEAAGVGLRLEDRPAHLDRVLSLTGTLEHLTASEPGGAADPPGEPGDRRPHRI
ncbi:STAS domain-containing protein (plasmid) [Streptomyces sp. BI20]|uniref:STAS domain-containing protein n=1 Tax=Streptomyces sp. BI20 TaxID=3403460 RepID=UPI003C74EBDD